jgi:hypothetical protein
MYEVIEVVYAEEYRRISTKSWTPAFSIRLARCNPARNPPSCIGVDEALIHPRCTAAQLLIRWVLRILGCGFLGPRLDFLKRLGAAYSTPQQGSTALNSL